jgi:hypothetical protein
MNRWLKRHRHLPIADQHGQLVRKLRGHYAYYGITSNWQCLSRFHFAVVGLWRKWLNRRSQRGHLGWERFTSLLGRYPLPRPRIVHSADRRAANPSS